VLGALIGKPGKQVDSSHSQLLLLINADGVERGFQLPLQSWHVLMDSRVNDAFAVGATVSQQLTLAGRSVMLLRGS
jgi:hypothetical protein